MDRDEQILETRRQEASLLFDAHQAGLATADRVMALALTLIGAAVAVGFDKNHREIFLVLPLGFALLLTYQLHVYADVKVMGVYRRHLEHAINKSLDERVLAYESGVAPTRHGSYSFSVTFAGWVYILIVIAVTIYGGYICHELYYTSRLPLNKHHSILPALIYGLFTGVGLVTLALAARDEEKSRSLATEALKHTLATGKLLPTPRDRRRIRKKQSQAKRSGTGSARKT
jgi:hypothetical protein